MTRTARRRWVAATALGFAAALVAASPAVAHVTVSPSTAPRGSFAVLAFRVPNERAGASTVKVQVDFPTDHPVPFVSVKPVPGWDYTVERRRLDTPVEAEGSRVTEVVARVTWTGGPIRPGEFQEFEVSAGPLPEDADELVFKALQTYDSGEVVRWIDPPAPGGEEPEHPAPVLRLTEGADDHHGGPEAGGAGTTTTTRHGAEPVATETAAREAGGDGRGLATAALVVAVLALVASLTAATVAVRSRPRA
jgi:uncharacterized protein YcnI